MTSTSVPAAVPRARVHVLPVVGIAAGVTWLGDLFFWNHPPGISVAIFAAVAAATLYASPGSERPSRPAWIAASLLLVSSWATLLEVSFSNIVVLLALLSVIMGERHFPEVPGSWARWSESLVAWASAAGRWPWLARSLGESELAGVGLDTLTHDRVAKSVQILVPAAALAVIFGVVLSFGNAIFRQLLTHLDTEVMTWVLSIDFSFLRLVLWVALATFALALVRPRSAPGSLRLWSRPIPRFLRSDATVAVWQSCAVFVVLNALFFIVNSIDVIYLWGGSGRVALPEGVTFSAFVHEGVYSLIFAVLLSAAVIAVIFQQEEKVARHGALRVLSWVWIAQNFLLIGGVFLRLKLYVDAYQLSELRVYVGCFLLLVTSGFCLLAWHVTKGESLGTLLWRNVLATFALFFVIQFPNVAGWVGHFNVAQWERQPRRSLDLAYIESLGPGAWPALAEVASSRNGDRPTIQKARSILSKIAAAESKESAYRDWRSYQARRSTFGQRLSATTAELSEAP